MRRNARQSRRSHSGFSRSMGEPTVIETQETDSSQGSETAQINELDENSGPGSGNPLSTLPNGGKDRKYDIASLLVIGQGTDPSSYPEKNRVRSETRDGNSVGRRGASLGSPVLTERAINRRRFSSSASTNADDGFQSSRIIQPQCPRRQPINAPQGARAQSDAGFARFLKEHSSPKHQRVTAGGRIVPMDSTLSPAPEFKLPIRQPEGKSGAKTDDPSNDNQSSTPTSSEESRTESQSIPRIEGESKTSKTRILRTRGASLPDSSAVTQPRAAASSGHSFAPSGTASQPTQQLTISLDQGDQQQLSAEASEFTPTYTTFGGGSNKSSSTSQQNYSQGPIPQYAPGTNSQLFQPAYGAQMGNILGVQPSQSMVATAPFQTYPVNNATGFPWMNPMQTFAAPFQPMTEGFHDTTSHKSLEEVTQERESMSAQLSGLDRYMALHMYSIDPLRKKALVNQRIELVRKLEALGIAKEYLETVSQPSKPSMMQEGHVNVTGQPQAHFPNMFTVAQAPSCAPGIAGNGMIQNSAMSSAADFQQLASTGPSFTSQSGGSQYANVSNYNTGYQTYPTQYNTSYHQPAATSGCNVAPEVGAYNNYGVFDYAAAGRAMVNDEEEIQLEADDWDRSTELAPSEISKIYQKIEQASQRGESIAPYLKDLAKIAAEMDGSIPNKNNATTQQLQRDQQNNKCDENLPAIPETGGAKNSTGKKSILSQNWVAGGQPSDGEEKKRMPAQGNPHGRSAAQVRLATLHGARGSQSSERVAGGSNMLQHENINPNSRIDGRQNRPDGTSSSGDRYKGNNPNEVKFNSHGMRDMYVASKGAMDGSSAEPAAANAPKRRSSLFSALMFAPWRQRWYGSTPQKGGTSAEAQKINVHGTLPSFDGSGDATERKPKDTGGPTSGQPNNAGKSKDERGAKNGGAAQWYRKEPRKEHDAMEVRGFFQLLREEDKELLRKNHHVNHRPLG